MAPNIRALGQGVRRDLTYTGDYGDSPDFGFVTFDAAMRLIRALPPYPREAAEEEMCPPTITLTDPAGASLTISRSVEGGYDIYFSGPQTGDVAANASFYEVREVVAGFFNGRYPKAVDYVKATGKVPGTRERELLSYMTLYEDYDLDTSTRIRVGMSLWRDPDGRTYFDIDEADGSVVRIPIEYVVEIVFKRGGFLRGSSVTIRYKRSDGSIGSLGWRIDKENRGLIERTAAKLSRYLPGRVRIE